MHMAERVPRYAHRRIAILHNGLHLSLFLLSKRRYFYNARTGEKSWTRPAAPQQPVGPAPEPAPDPAPAPAVGADEVRRLTAPVIPALSDPSNVASKMQTHLLSDFLTRYSLRRRVKLLAAAAPKLWSRTWGCGLLLPALMPMEMEF